MIHIEGMGALGSQVALALDEIGEPFTWSDTDERWVAWKASTGCVYPSGDAHLEAGRRWWLAAIEAGRFEGIAAPAPYRFAHLSPPHGGGYSYADLASGRLREAMPPAVTVNVERLVTTTRERFADRRAEPEPGATVVVAHTTPERGDGYLWGWSARVRFAEPEPSTRGRAVYNAKKHRYNNTYAYPVPGTDQWWAGSTMQMVREPREREARAHVAEWTVNAGALLGLAAIEVGEIRQGWRPRRRKDDPGDVRQDDRGRWVLPPIATSGIQTGPLVARETLRRLGLQP